MKLDKTSPIHLAIVKDGSQWANSAAANLIQSFIDHGTGKLYLGKKVIKKITPTMWGNYIFYGYEGK